LFNGDERTPVMFSTFGLRWRAHQRAQDSPFFGAADMAA